MLKVFEQNLTCLHVSAPTRSVTFGGHYYDNALISGFGKWPMCLNHSGYGLRQWAMALYCNFISYWLCLYPEWSLHIKHYSIQALACNLRNESLCVYNDVLNFLSIQILRVTCLFCFTCMSSLVCISTACNSSHCFTHLPGLCVFLLTWA